MAMRFYPLGYPVDIVTSSEAALAAARKSWGAWPSLFHHAPPMRFEIETHNHPAPRNVPHFEAPAGWLRFSAGGHNFAVFELESRTGYMSVGGGALGDEAGFRHHWLEALVLTALDSVFFTPLHAACVARDGAGTLLCGDSGAGKSSLAYACARRGWTLVSDDAVHLAPGPEEHRRGRIEFHSSSRAGAGFFPGVGRVDAGTAPNGKRAIEIDARAKGWRTARYAVRVALLFSAAKAGPAAVRPFPADARDSVFPKVLVPARDGRRRRGICAGFFRRNHACSNTSAWRMPSRFLSHDSGSL